MTDKYLRVRQFQHNGRASEWFHSLLANKSIPFLKERWRSTLHEEGLELDPPTIAKIISHPRKKYIAVSTGDHRVRIYDSISWTVRISGILTMRTVWAMAFDPSGDYLATGSSDGIVSVWDTNDEVSGEARCVFDCQWDSSIEYLGFLPHSGALLVISGKKMYLLDVFRCVLEGLPRNSVQCFLLSNDIFTVCVRNDVPVIAFVSSLSKLVFAPSNFCNLKFNGSVGTMPTPRPGGGGHGDGENRDLVLPVNVHPLPPVVVPMMMDIDDDDSSSDGDDEVTISVDTALNDLGTPPTTSTATPQQHAVDSFAMDNEARQNAPIDFTVPNRSYIDQKMCVHVLRLNDFEQYVYSLLSKNLNNREHNIEPHCEFQSAVEVIHVAGLRTSNGISLSPDGNMIAVAGGNHIISVYRFDIYSSVVEDHVVLNGILDSSSLSEDHEDEDIGDEVIPTSIDWLPHCTHIVVGLGCRRLIIGSQVVLFEVGSKRSTMKMECTWKSPVMRYLSDVNDLAVIPSGLGAGELRIVFGDSDGNLVDINEDR